MICSIEGIKKEKRMSLEGFLKQHNLSLTEQQKEAVSSIDGPTLLLAVPGSGKTTVLVSRLGYMVYEKGINPEDILTLTYTVAATKDMSSRFIKFFGDEFSDRLEFRTINGVCARIINYFSRIIGKEAFELEVDESARNKRISAIYREVEKNFASESDIREIGTFITYIKNMMLNEAEIAKLSEKTDYDLKKIYQTYVKSMKQDGKMDYDDQMTYALNILKSSKETLHYFQNKYKYICVDEAQDTSKIQHVIIALLARNNENLFLVGDEDQSIYNFRAAYSTALLSFPKDHKGAKVLLLEENFRSNAKIVEAADKFIQKNTMRHKKTMRAHRDSGEEIKLEKLGSREKQFTYLFDVLKDVKEETAVLYKNNDSIIPMVDRLEREGIPFKIRNAELAFFTSRVVVDIMNILKLAHDPFDFDTFMQVYYKVGIYIGKDEAQQICNIAKNKKISIFKAYRYLDFKNEFSKQAFVDFAFDMELVEKKKTYDAIHFIISSSGYARYLERAHIDPDKAFILKEIARITPTYADFLRRFAELQTILKENDAPADCNIIFSTIHSSKGLEYKNVYMLDIIDGIFPDTHDILHMNKDERVIYEEERRVFYVGITRAKDRLVLFDTGDKSSFINEICRRFKPAPEKKKKEEYCPQISYQEFCDSLKPGISVEHDKFGKGVIVKLNIPYVEIDFGEQIKRFGLPLLHTKGLLRISDDES